MGYADIRAERSISHFGLGADLRWYSICLGRSSIADVVDGPHRTLATLIAAAAQLHQTGHSCIAQQYPHTGWLQRGPSRLMLLQQYS